MRYLQTFNRRLRHVREAELLRRFRKTSIENRRMILQILGA
ncbi:hypothetical protein [Marinobacter sp.]|nr:hypothetical protein [Marinobacter sp.]